MMKAVYGAGLINETEKKTQPKARSPAPPSADPLPPTTTQRSQKSKSKERSKNGSANRQKDPIVISQVSHEILPEQTGRKNK
jgi:hypothetical protein